MRVTAAILAILAIPVWAGDFFIGDTAVGPGHPRGNLGRVVLSSDGETAYVFAKYGMNRVRPDGVVLDSEPFGLSEMFDPYSAAYGRGILVVTHQVINSLSANLSYATAVTTAGDILWSHFVAPTQAAVVYDGRDFVIVYHYEDSIRAAVLDENGFAARVMTLAAVSSVVRIGAPIVVRTDRGLLAVWRENGDIRAVPFDASGPRGDAITVGTGILSAGFGNELNGSFGVATNGDAALVVWANRLLEDPRTPWLAARHLDGDGVPIGAAIEIPLSDRAMDVEVVWDGAVYRMVWAALSADFRQLRLESASISPGAAEASAVEPVSSGTAMLSPSLTVAGGRATLAWNDRQHGGVRGKFANPGASFALAPEQVFRTVPYDAIAPAVAWSGQHYVTAWLRAPGIFADMSVVVRR